MIAVADIIDLPECEKCGCTDKAFFEYTWLPDEPIKVCVHHIVGVMRLADAMGYDLPKETVKILPDVEETFAAMIPEYFERMVGFPLPESK